MSDAVRVVFDTQIFLRAAIKPQSGSGRLFSEWGDYYTLYLADEIKAEIIDVYTRPEIRTKFPQITDSSVNNVRRIFAKAIHVEVKPEDVEKISRDPKDDIFLACAKIAKADYLVSEDKYLLVLQKHGDTAIVDVATFLTILEKPKTDDSE